MKILILAPQPFYQQRGTPIAVDLLLRVLSDRGDQVDLLTLHEGEDREYPGLHIYRIKPFLKIQDVRPGLSGKKLLCDCHMFIRLVSLMRKERYDVVHAIEEGAFMALVVCFLRKVPFIYDMDSSMATQIVDKLRFMRPFRGVLQFLESICMRAATAVVPVCDALAADAARAGARRIVVLKDISLLESKQDCDTCGTLRREIDLPKYIAMYIGNLEPYQGIDLMLESFALLSRQRNDVALVVIGGADSDIEKYEKLAGQLGIGSHVHFMGRRPVEDLGKYMSQADMLVSPRIQGVNTPMKVYSYLDSGVAVLATDLPTHTQVMTNKTAMLAPPDRRSFAEAMLRLLENDELRTALARNAKRLIEKEHSYEAFKGKVYGLYDRLEREVCGARAG